MPACMTCRVSCPRGVAYHLSTARHRRATRPKASLTRKARGRPSWMLAQRHRQEDFASPDELAAAEAWARGA